ncbi:MAG: FHA domain-containing protein [Bacteriovoracaceae bacterium]|nr:FHA domain-containing protein [Bacteriovoracaceae bacterium]
MFKLVAVGGKLRGKEITLNEGENIFGRGQDCTHMLSVQGISKRHMNISVNQNTLYIEDLGSSNGTFVNGKIVKRKTLAPNDKIALPDVIFQLIYRPEKNEQFEEKAPEEDDGELVVEEKAPDNIVAKVVFLFRTKFMPVIYGFNEQYEWGVLLGILLGIFLAVNIALTISPVLTSSKRILIYEVAKRGMHYADEVARINNLALQRRDLDRIDTQFLDKETGVISYELFDLEGRIVRPITKLNSYSNDTLSIKTKEWIQKQDKPLVDLLAGDEIGIGGPIKAFDTRTGREEVVGGISIRFKPDSLVAEVANSSQAYFEALTTSVLVAILFFGAVYYMTKKHLDDMYIQIEESVRGKRKDLESNLLMKELDPLRNSINSILQRFRETQNKEDGFVEEIEEEGPYLRKLEDFLAGAQGPVLVLNSEKNIKRLNSEAEDLLGIRENASSGNSLLDTARDQGFAATVIELCDQSASNEGCNQKNNYDISGVAYGINVVALMGKDKFAKGFYITFVKD